MTEHKLKANSGVQVSASAKRVIKRGDQSLGYLVAIYATLLTAVTAIVGFFEITGFCKAVITVTIIIILYKILFFTSLGRRLVLKEIARMQDFEEK